MLFDEGRNGLKVIRIKTMRDLLINYTEFNALPAALTQH